MARHLKETQRKRLIEAIVFFGRNTENCGKQKLFKLLFEFDRRHAMETGVLASSLTWKAIKNGPIPEELYNEWSEFGEDAVAAFHIDKVRQWPHLINPTELVSPIREADLSVFTKREKKILDAVAQEFRVVNGSTMSDRTHEPDTPWFKVYTREKRKNGYLHLSDFLDSHPDKDALLERSERMRELDAILMQ